MIDAEFLLYLTLIAVSVGIIVAVIVCFAIIKRYKKALQSPIYPLEHYASLDLSHSRDNFIGKTVSKVRVSSSSSSSSKRHR